MLPSSLWRKNYYDNAVHVSVTALTLEVIRTHVANLGTDVLTRLAAAVEIDTQYAFPTRVGMYIYV